MASKKILLTAIILCTMKCLVFSWQNPAAKGEGMFMFVMEELISSVSTRSNSKMANVSYLTVQPQLVDCFTSSQRIILIPCKVLELGHAYYSVFLLVLLLFTSHLHR